MIKILRIITCGLIHIVLFLCTNNDRKSCYVCQLKQYFMYENLNSLVIQESDRVEIYPKGNTCTFTVDTTTVLLQSVLAKVKSLHTSAYVNYFTKIRGIIQINVSVYLVRA